MDNDAIVDTLNDLIEICKDGAYGFQRCAQHCRSTELRSLFTRRAGECRRAAQELLALVVQHGGEPDEGGSAMGGVHRGWVTLVGSVAGSSDQRMLEEAERGEGAALARYRDATRDDDLPPAARAAVWAQMARVQRNHAEIKRLRNQTQATTG